MNLSQILDRERARVAAERRAAIMAEALDRERERAEQHRTANRLMEDTIQRTQESTARVRSMLDDQWAAYERVTQDRDFWKREAAGLAEKLADTNAMLDRLMIERGRVALDGEAPTAPLRLVKEGAA